MTITAGDKSWRPAYLMLLAYVAACALMVVFAPNTYSPRLPTSGSLARVSTFPSTAAFCVDAMWAAFPIVLTAFSALAPVKLRHGAGRGDIPILVFAFLFFGACALAALYFGMFSEVLDTESRTRIARLTGLAARSRFGLVYAASFYCSTTLLFVWLSCVAVPRAFLRISRQARA